jgi:hypothetical protein
VLRDGFIGLADFRGERVCQAAQPGGFEGGFLLTLGIPLGMAGVIALLSCLLLDSGDLFDRRQGDACVRAFDRVRSPSKLAISRA